MTDTGLRARIAALELEIDNLSAELAAAQEAAQQRMVFIANLGHEIRTPMQAIIGFSGLLRSELPSGEAREHVDRVVTASNLIMQLIDDTLDLSRINTGNLVLEMRDFDMASLVTWCTSFVLPQAQEKGLRVVLDASRATGSYVGDPTRLSQAMLNLVVNAVKFTRTGFVTIRASCQPADDGDAMFGFEVEDTGVGIAPDMLQRLFQPLGHGGPAPPRRSGGLGLGLALTRRLARQMGGDCGARSTPGEGSTFWFTARVKPTAAAVTDVRRLWSPRAVDRPLAEAAIRERFSGVTVLVVDDDRFNLEVARAVLVRAGLHVDTADTGQEAFELAREHRYALVLMDLHMPILDGFEATRAIRAVPGYEATPVIALTADSLPESRRACLESGMNDLVCKPVTPQQLRELLLQWLPEVAVHPLVCANDRDKAAALLRGLASIDPVKGLAMTSGDAEAFLDLLRGFVEHHADGLPQLDELLATGDLAGARRIVHSVKGAAAAIGATALRGMAGSLEEAIREGQRMERLRLAAFDLDYELVRLVAQLQERLPPRPRRDARPRDASWQESLRSLRSMLASGDWEARRIWRDVEPEMRQAYGEHAHVVSAAVDKGDYEAAISAIDGLCSAHAGQPAGGES